MAADYSHGAVTVISRVWCTEVPVFTYHLLQHEGAYTSCRNSLVQLCVWGKYPVLSDHSFS